jgi:hypothetical protein
MEYKNDFQTWPHSSPCFSWAFHRLCLTWACSSGLPPSLLPAALTIPVCYKLKWDPTHLACLTPVIATLYLPNASWGLPKGNAKFCCTHQELNRISPLRPQRPCCGPSETQLIHTDLQSTTSWVSTAPTRELPKHALYVCVQVTNNKLTLMMMMQWSPDDQQSGCPEEETTRRHPVPTNEKESCLHRSRYRHHAASDRNATVAVAAVSSSRPVAAVSSSSSLINQP